MSLEQILIDVKFRDVMTHIFRRVIAKQLQFRLVCPQNSSSSPTQCRATAAFSMKSLSISYPALKVADDFIGRCVRLSVPVHLPFRRLAAENGPRVYQ